jgi:hypothetical protein
MFRVMSSTYSINWVSRIIFAFQSGSLHMTSMTSCCLCAISYRPITLTCISCKLMEHIITSHIMKHADTHTILYPLQHGFRKGLSCETQLIEFVDDITRNIDAGKQTDCLIMEVMMCSISLHKIHVSEIGL